MKVALTLLTRVVENHLTTSEEPFLLPFRVADVQ